MDYRNFQELNTCGVCRETFDEGSKCPRILSCGHSFCHSCLVEVLAQSPRPGCPSCRAEIRFPQTELIPINYAIISFLNIRGFFSKPSKEAQKKQMIMQRVEEELGERDTFNERLTQSLKVLDDERKSLIEEAKDREKRIEELNARILNENTYFDKLQQFQTLVVNSENEAEISKAIGELELFMERRKSQIPNELPHLHLPKTLEALETLCQNGPVYTVEDRYGGTKYGKVAVKDGQIWIYSFRPEKPIAIIYNFKELLCQFSKFTKLPKSTFLQLSDKNGEEDDFEITIKIEGHFPRAKNFLLVCSALKGTCYKGLTTGNGVFSVTFPGPPSVVENVGQNDNWVIQEKGGVYAYEYDQTPVDTLFSFGYDQTQKDTKSSFQVIVEDVDALCWPDLQKFGVVVSGLQNLKESKVGKWSVTECGLVI